MAESSKDPDEGIGDASLAEALERFCAQVDEGLDPDPPQFLEEHKEQGDLAACLEGLAAIEELRAALKSEDNEPLPAPRTLGDYQIVREVGRGGMGLVYKAWDSKLQRHVALKMIKAGDLARPDELQRFQAEARAVAKLQHTGIVQIYEVGEHEGRPFLALEFVEGVSLETCIRQAPLLPHPAAELVQTLARAIHFAHTQQIVHRDLKPANILLKDEGGRMKDEKPDSSFILPPSSFTAKITDFGLAKRLDVEGQTHTGAVLGTPPYMAPEQADGRTHAIGPGTDVYALGAILYEALTGRPPFKAATALETLHQVLHDEPVPPRRLQPRLPVDLETICLKCLHKEPARRYASAHDLAEDLGRFLRGEPILARPVGPIGRMWRRCRRNPVVASLVTAAALLLLAVTGLTVGHLAREAGRREEILEGNIYEARGVADRFRLQLRELSGAVVETAADAKLLRLLEEKDTKGLQPFFVKIQAKYEDPRHGIGRAGKDPPFEGWYCLNDEGVIVAITGLEQVAMKNIMENPNFRGRDYFHGAMRRAGKKGREAVHISRIYKASEDGLFRFGISAPVYNKGEKVVGVVVGTVITDPTMGLDRLHDERRKAVLYGPMDPNLEWQKVSGPRAPSEFVILIHPAYDRGVSAVLFHAGKPPSGHPLPHLEELGQPDPQQTFNPAGIKDYVDPVGDRHAEFQGHWLAGFAPVGNTELVVIVQQKEGASTTAVIGQWVIWAGISLLLVVLVAGVVFWFRTRRAGQGGDGLVAAGATTLTQ